MVVKFVAGLCRLSLALHAACNSFSMLAECFAYVCSCVRLLASVMITNKERGRRGRQ